MSSGPIPSADELARYESVLPGAADRLLTVHERGQTLIEEQAHHRFSLETSALHHNNVRSYLGVGVGGLVVIAGFWVAYEFAKMGHPVEGSATSIFDIVGLAGVFVLGTQSQRKERQDRLHALLSEQKNTSNK